ncbi:hypothetical protein [Streptomyces zhihengii]|uniref:hypothetical protein n=1 Tax=Streptomyces zhihengii TaxID=1818004 RepID=UPI0033AF969B
MASLPPRRLGVTGFSTALYRSPSCRIGTHLTCTTSSTAVAPPDLPVVFETCDCTCHSAAGRSAQAEEGP